MNGDREFERLLAQRDLSWQHMLRSMGDALVVRGSGVVPTEEEPAASRFAFDLAGAMASPEFEARRAPLRDVREQDDLIGAARLYGIVGAESMPLSQLQDMIAERRELVREQDEVTSLPRALYEGAAVSAGLLGTAALQQPLRLLGNFAERFAFMGGSVARSTTMREADRWLSMVQEGLTADMPEGPRKLYRGVAGAIGMFAPAAFTWQLAGAAGTLPGLARIGKAITPVGRVMVRGAATEAALQDPTVPLHEQAINAGLGALFGLGDLAGTAGRVMTGAGIGAMAGAVADDGDPLTMLISAGAGAATFGLGGAALRKVQRDFPSRIAPEVAGFRPPEGPTLDAAFTMEGGAAQLGAGPGMAVGPLDAPLAGAYPRPEYPRQLRGLLGLPPGPQEGIWSAIEDPALLQAPPLALSPGQRLLPSGFPDDVPPDYSPEVQRAVWGRLQNTYETFARQQPENVFVERGPDGSVIGYLQLGEGRIQTVGVHPDFRRQGVGTRLYERAAAAGHPIEQMSDVSGQYGNLSPMGAAFQQGRRLKALEASQEAAQLTKQESILESPAFAELSNHAILDDASVARAVVESYPGQVGIVQNVQDVSGTLRKILMEQMPSGVGPQDFRVVQRPVVSMSIQEVHPGDFDIRTFTPQGVPILAVADLQEGNLFIDTLGETPSELTVVNPYEAPLPGPRWVRQAGGEVIHQFRQMGHTVNAIAGERVTGARSANPDADVDLLLPASRFRRKTVTDILVSSGKPISSQTVKEYEQFGMFSGQRARLYSGQEVLIESLGSDFSRVKSLHSGASLKIATHQVLPMKSSQVVDDIPGLYEDFASFARVRLDQQSRQAGILPFELLSNEGATQAPLLMEEYIKGIGVDPRSYYGASLRWLMEQKHIEALRTTAPADERAMLEGLQSEYRQLVEEVGLPEPTLDDLAQARGFTVIKGDVPVDTGPIMSRIMYESEGWDLEEGWAAPPRDEDLVELDRQEMLRRLGVARPAQPTVYPPLHIVRDEPIVLSDSYSKGAARAEFDSEDSAREFLQGIHREPIDDSPVGHVPLEVMETPLGYSMIGGQTPGVYRNADHWLEQTTDLLDSLEEPPVPPGGGGGPPGLPPVGQPLGLPEGDDPWGSAFEQADKNHPVAYRKALGRLDSFVSKAYLPTRNYAIRLDSELGRLGVPSYERMMVALQDAHNTTVNKAFPWEQQAITELSKVRRRLRRDGTLWNIMNSEVSQWQQMMDAAEMTVDERQAVTNLQNLFIKFDIDEVINAFPEIAQRESFVNHFRRFEEALPGDSPTHPSKATFGPAGAEQEGVNWVAEKNLDAIVARYFRTFYKTQHMNAPYEMLKNSTQDKRVPQVVKKGVGDWAKARMWGLDPTTDILIKASHSLLDGIMSRFGYRVSVGEVSSLFHAEMGVSYLSGLGARPEVIIRDMPQALIGQMHVGLDKGAPIFMKLLRDPEYRDAAMELAFDAGWAVRGHGMAVDPDIFAGSAFTTLQAGRQPTVTQAPAVERVADWMSDHALKKLGFNRGLQGSWADPLKAYGWQSDWARVWNGMTGYDTAWNALAKYDARKLYQSAPAEELEKELLDNARVARFQGTIQDGFLEFARRGDYEGAARYFGRHVADSQNRYGMSEHPQVWRNLGPATGRRAMKWLTFNSQMLAEFGQITADPRISVPNKAAYLGQVGAMQTLYAIGQATTGWNLMKMSLLGVGFGLAGSSIFDLVNNAQRMAAWWNQFNPTGGLTPDQAALLAAGQRSYGSQLLTTDLSQASWNPWAGAMRTAANLTESAQWGGEAMLRTLVTGQAGDPSVERRQMGLEPYSLQLEDQPYYNPQPGGSQ